MNNSSKKPIIGLLGGIGSGKSTVAGEFARLGCKVIDADEIAHELLDEKDVVKAVVDTFGCSILGCEGKTDRHKLANIVFSDSDKLSALTHILHPVVLGRVEGLIKEYERHDEVKAIILDMPLLIESGWDKKCDKLVFVGCDWPLRVKRAEKTGRFDENELKIREKFQISLDNKAKLADNAVSNNSDFSALAKQVVDIFSGIMNGWG